MATDLAEAALLVRSGALLEALPQSALDEIRP